MSAQYGQNHPCGIFLSGSSMSLVGCTVADAEEFAQRNFLGWRASSASPLPTVAVWPNGPRCFPGILLPNCSIALGARLPQLSKAWSTMAWMLFVALVAFLHYKYRQNHCYENDRNQCKLQSLCKYLVLFKPFCRLANNNPGPKPSISVPTEPYHFKHYCN